ncbi:MAG: hypothetical protein KDB53_09175 [Planctomycetes bacterium]|nr:hypothetical protein [Planctomycetota bacterium]
MFLAIVKTSLRETTRQRFFWLLVASAPALVLVAALFPARLTTSRELVTSLTPSVGLALSLTYALIWGIGSLGKTRFVWSAERWGAFPGSSPGLLMAQGLGQSLGLLLVWCLVLSTSTLWLGEWPAQQPAGWSLWLIPILQGLELLWVARLLGAALPSGAAMVALGALVVLAPWVESEWQTAAWKPWVTAFFPSIQDLDTLRAEGSPSAWSMLRAIGHATLWVISCNLLTSWFLERQGRLAAELDRRPERA